MPAIDLNSDMGEGYGAWRMADDEALMPFISSANVACGAHAGDPNTMSATVAAARRHGVAVGAHPGYPDLIGFGRRPLQMAPEEVTRWVLYQLGALWAVARSEGVALRHVKPHGALYNSAARDLALAQAIASAIARFSKSLLFVCLPGSEMEHAGHEVGLRVLTEGFADRSYEPNGSLTDRRTPGAVHSSVERAVQQAVWLAAGRVVARDGSELKLHVDTICIHSDTPGAVGFARAVNEALQAAGYEIKAVAGA